MARQARAAGRQGAATPGGFAAAIILPTTFTMGLAGIWHGAGLHS
jgi:hypothetical protein